MYQVKAYQLARFINIEECKQALTWPIVFQDSDELFYEVKPHAYVYVFLHGMVSFFNLTEDEIAIEIKKLKPHCTTYFSEKISEEFSIIIEPSVQEVEFNLVKLPSLDSEMIRLVMLNTSQSVALNRYSEITESLLQETNIHTKYLENKGKLDISGNKLKRFIGKTLNIKNGILENLYIFDSPNVTWEDENLNKLNSALKQTFDLKDRYTQIQERINIIKENLELFKDIMDHQESSKLEWIIIILILVEVVDMFILKFI